MTYIEKCESSCIMIVASFVCYAALFRYETNIILHNIPTSPCSETGMSTKGIQVLCDIREFNTIHPAVRV
jgi:hypothetical protein